MAGTIKSLGIDIGSVSVKAVSFAEDRLERTVYRRFHGRPFETLCEKHDQEFTDRNGQ